MAIKDENKKGQQEMIGFAFVIVLVVIIGLVFLLLALRQPSSIVERESFRVNNLLNGISYYTTECEGKNIQQLIIECQRRSFICEDPCNLAREEISQILESSLKGDYSFTARVESEVEDRDLIDPIKKEAKGECPGKRVVLKAISVLPNNILVKLVSCPVPKTSS